MKALGSSPDGVSIFEKVNNKINNVHTEHFSPESSKVAAFLRVRLALVLLFRPRNGKPTENHPQHALLLASVSFCCTKCKTPLAHATSYFTPWAIATPYLADISKLHPRVKWKSPLMQQVISHAYDEQPPVNSPTSGSCISRLFNRAIRY